MPQFCTARDAAVSFCESKVEAKKIQSFSLCCSVFSTFAVLLLSIWGFQLCNNSMSIEVNPQTKKRSGICCFIAAAMYGICGIICVIYLIDYRRRNIANSSQRQIRPPKGYISVMQSQTTRRYTVGRGGSIQEAPNLTSPLLTRD